VALITAEATADNKDEQDALGKSVMMMVSAKPCGRGNRTEDADGGRNGVEGSFALQGLGPRLLALW